MEGLMDFTGSYAEVVRSADGPRRFALINDEILLNHIEHLLVCINHEASMKLC